MLGRLYIESRSPSGIVIERREQPIHSFVSNFLRVIANKWGTTDQDVTLTEGGTLKLVDHYSEASTTDQRGIVIGTDDTASDFQDTNLGARIVGGTGPGQMTVGDQVETVNASSGIWTAEIERTFANNSGSAITVREVGVFSSSIAGPTSTINRHLTVRDVLGTPIEVPNGGELYVKFAFDVNTSNVLNHNGGHWINAFAKDSSTTVVRINGAGGSFRYNQIVPVTSGLGSEIGLRVGTGTAAYNKDTSVQFSLETPITHGNGSGQLVHGETTRGAVSDDATGGTFRISRSFFNDSGGEITVREIAIYGGTSSGNDIFMHSRHVFDTPIAIANGAGETFFADISMTH